MNQRAFAFQTLRDLREAGRDELADYLRSWGFSVDKQDGRAQLLSAAIVNFESEGAGYGPLQMAA
ncbi:hypothetical protein KSF73_09145 [Burkholderiaceae bacterium DAT-1]|nr:hypothetical protein [Burkholderiaceae bacterium DAT-1]